MAESVPSNEPGAQRRRSTRIVQAVPLTVIGVDALGQPFKERTSSLMISCHGCKYQSKHYVPKNSSVTLEVPRPEGDRLPRSVRARVVWVQRPRTVRELFQIGVELESPANVWGIAFPPSDWMRPSDEGEDAAPSIPSPAAEREERTTSAPEPFTSPTPLPPASSKIQIVSEELSSSQSPLSMNFARQMARMLADAKQSLQQTVHESANAAVLEATRGVHLQIEAQLRQTIDKSVEAALARVEAHAAERSADLSAQARPAEAHEPSPEWIRAAEQNLKSIANHVTSQLAEVTEAQRAALTVHAERIVGEARKQADGIFGRIEADAGAAQEQLAESRREIETAATSIRAESTQSLAAFHGELAQQISQAKGSLEEIQAAGARAKETAAQLARSADSVVAQAARRLEALLQARDVELQQHAEKILVERVRQMQPQLDAMAQQVIGRMTTQVQQQLAPQIEFAQRVKSELVSSEKSAEQIVASLPQRLAGAAEQALRESGARLREQMAQFPAEVEAACQASVAKATEELDAKSNEVTHTTFESLFKSSEWYQKKAQTSMQAALERSLDQATDGLRERAAEISRLFASELDHYSRSYVEHTQGLLEETAKDSVALGREQLRQAAETTAAALSDELHRTSTQAHEKFQDAIRQSGEQASAHFETRAEGLRAHMDAHLENYLGEFEQHLNQRVGQGLEHARQALDKQLMPMIEKWRQEREQQHRAWLARLNQAGAEGIEAYRQRLENASNSWLVASVATLSQHSEDVIKAMAQAAETRLRDTCSQVFSGIGETLRQRLLGISNDLAPGQNPPSQKK